MHVYDEEELRHADLQKEGCTKASIHSVENTLSEAVFTPDDWLESLIGGRAEDQKWIGEQIITIPVIPCCAAHILTLLISLSSRLNLVILRPAVVYGVGAMGGLSKSSETVSTRHSTRFLVLTYWRVVSSSVFLRVAPRLICGRVYKHLDKKMEFLWTENLSINTVHVNDVSRAIWHTANWYATNGKQGSVIFNLADTNSTGMLLLGKKVGLENHCVPMTDNG